EKDGLWAVLFWLNLLAARQQSGDEILREHWQTYGRDYYQRYDYFIADSAKADALFSALKESANKGECNVTERNAMLVDNFTYHDPVDGSESKNQGVRIQFDDDSRIIYRLSGTGTSGATLRVYLQQYETDTERLTLDTTELLKPLGKIAAKNAGIEKHTGLTSPTARI
ncbi:MAG: alpha-D-glucose phosphate-specific phosphoglucomutase, partial [Gammaproteobacteria bacterium]|nr:alpha-D-glucose phosphate-specific phosphoglucomutase [Gammaproteobacteria bacterium]